MYVVNFNPFPRGQLVFWGSAGDRAVLRFLAAGAGAWKVISGVGPLSSTQALGTTGGPTATNLGDVTVSSITGPTTLTASLGGSAVPESSTLVMFGLGLCVDVVARRRR